MRKYKKELVCVKCGRKFSVEVPDCITPRWEKFLKEPRCFKLYKVKRWLIHECSN